MTRTAVGLLLVLGIVTAACSSGEGDSTTMPPAPTTTGAPPTAPPPDTTVPRATTTLPATSSVPTTTTVAPATTTTSPSTTMSPPTTAPPSDGFTVGAPRLAPPDPRPGADGASGSGCDPGGGALPDGIWFGYLEAIAAGEVGFDLACFFFGDAAVPAAAADGQPAPEGPFYIRNLSPALRTVTVAPGAPVYVVVAPLDSGLSFAASDLASFTSVPDAYGVGFLCPGEFCGMWLYVNGGVATEIMEQYLP